MHECVTRVTGARSAKFGQTLYLGRHANDGYGVVGRVGRVCTFGGQRCEARVPDYTQPKQRGTLRNDSGQVAVIAQF